uniref:Uncharacterized protein n=1 Tax=Timema cristinae TaxID=61476 RepID=A0A7R9GTS2_TIMCR|nr:unnamed protein product [Timema cristinae]
MEEQLNDAVEWTTLEESVCRDYLLVLGDYIYWKCTRIWVRGVYNHFEKPPSLRDWNLGLPIISNLVHCESYALHRAATETGFNLIDHDLFAPECKKATSTASALAENSDIYLKPNGNIMLTLTVHPTEIRTSISPSSEVELNTSSALVNYATEVGQITSKVGTVFTGARMRISPADSATTYRVVITLNIC